MSEEDVALADQGEVARGFVAGLLEAMGLEGTTAVVEVDEDTVEVQVDGPDLGMLIGPKGQTLTALQDLARTVVQRRTGARRGWVVVDIGGYRKKRKDALERFTRQVAEQVVAEGARKALDPMSAGDRKIVHDTVNTIEGVQTISEGEDPRRRVVLLPGDG